MQITFSETAPLFCVYMSFRVYFQKLCWGDTLMVFEKFQKVFIFAKPRILRNFGKGHIACKKQVFNVFHFFAVDKFFKRLAEIGFENTA